MFAASFSCCLDWSNGIYLCCDEIFCSIAELLSMSNYLKYKYVYWCGQESIYQQEGRKLVKDGVRPTKTMVTDKYKRKDMLIISESRTRWWWNEGFCEGRFYCKKSCFRYNTAMHHWLCMKMVIMIIKYVFVLFWFRGPCACKRMKAFVQKSPNQLIIFTCYRNYPQQCYETGNKWKGTNMFVLIHFEFVPVHR